MDDIMIFEGHEVEVFELDGKVYFNPRHVGECLDVGDSAVRKAIAKMNDKQVRLLDNSDVKDIPIRKLNNAGENFLTESGVFKLIFKSNKPNAEKFTDWVTDWVLPTIRKTGKYELKNDSQPEKTIESGAALNAEITAFTKVSENLDMAYAEKLSAYHKIYARHDMPADVLPAQEEKAKETIKEPTALSVLPKIEDGRQVALFSASQLLKKHGCKVSSIAFNRKMMKAGFLADTSYINSKGHHVAAKALINEGLNYGPVTLRDTPHYFEHKFMGLFNRLLFLPEESDKLAS